MGWLWHIYGAVVRVPPSQTFHKEILQLCNEGPLNAWLWAKIDMVSNNCLLLHAAKKNRIQTSVCVSMCLGGWVRMCICLLLMSTRVCGHVKDWQAKRVRWNSVCVCVCVCVSVSVCGWGGGWGWVEWGCSRGFNGHVFALHSAHSCDNCWCEPHSPLVLCDLTTMNCRSVR